MKQKLILEYLISTLTSDMRASRLTTPHFALERRPTEIWKQKVFCILSSQFNAHRAASISESFVKEVPLFDYSWPFYRLQEACFEFLRSPKIGYRFPKTRAIQISLCWFPFAQIKDAYHEYVRSFDTEEKARSEITAIFPGMGLKQASMFLRNIGACKNLSVIDVHLLHYLNICHNWKVTQLTPKRYLEAEDILRRDASRYGLELNVFDPIVWAASKAIKGASANV